MHELLHRSGGGLVHHLQPGRNDAGGDDPGHGIPGLDHIVKGCQHALG
jgi:hypothetical protein